MADEKKTSLGDDNQPPSSRRISRRAFLSGAAGAAALGAYAAPTLSVLPLAEAQVKGSPPKDEKAEMEKGTKDGSDKGQKDGTDKAQTDKVPKEKEETDKGSKDGKDKSETDKPKDEMDMSGEMFAPDQASRLILASGPRRDEWS